MTAATATSTTRYRLFRCLAMATKKRGLIQRLFGSKKTSFESVNTEEEEAAALQAFKSSSTAFTRRHTVDVETFRGEMSDHALIEATRMRAAERHISDVGLLRRLYLRVKPHREPTATASSKRRHPDSLPRSTSPVKPPKQPPSQNTFVGVIVQFFSFHL